MIKKKPKKCKGTGKAKGYGCSQIKYIQRYGLCSDCFKNWVYNTDEGKELLKKTITSATKKVAKETRKKKKYVKWIDKPLNEMVQYVQFKIVNPYIKLRDNTCYGRCISSGNAIIDAGHFFATTEIKLRFNVQNIHGQNHSDNRFKGGNLQAYKEGLISRHGQSYFNTLERLKTESKDWPKIDRVELIKIGKTYEYLTRNRIWCFTHLEFENWKNLINK